MVSSPNSPPKRPRLSLQIKAISNGPTGHTSRTLAAAVNPRSPTSFNTLSNVYVTAIGKSPIDAEPVTAIKTRGLPLKLQTQTHHVPVVNPTAARPPTFNSLPDTPLTAQPLSPAVQTSILFPSTMTATPPLSAGPVDTSAVFTFSYEDITRRPSLSHHIPGSPRPRRRTTAPGSRAAPYSPNPRSLHSILRNSPLPQLPTRSPISPRRQSRRLAEKAARRVGYNNPLTQTITTNKYTKSHIDLLREEASPYSATPTSNIPPDDATTPADNGVLDLAMAYTGDETRDGGQTPGPFEEMRRRMAGLAPSSPLSSPSGIKKRKRREKKRRWVWTIGVEEEDLRDANEEVGGAVAAIRAAEAAAAGTPPPSFAPATALPVPAASPPLTTIPKLCIDTMAVFNQQQHLPPMEVITPSIESSDFSSQLGSEASESNTDVEMSDASSVMSFDGVDRGLLPGEPDYDMITPTLARKRLCSSSVSSRLGSEDVSSLVAGSRRDTPIPAHLTCS